MRIAPWGVAGALVATLLGPGGGIHAAAAVSPTPSVAGCTSTSATHVSISTTTQQSPWGVAPGAESFAITVTRAGGFGTWGGTIMVYEGTTKVATLGTAIWSPATPDTLTTSWSWLFGTVGGQPLQFYFGNSIQCPSSSAAEAEVVVLGLSTPVSQKNPSLPGSAVTLSTSLVGATGTTFASYSGTVTFYAGTVPIGKAALANGTASISVSTLSIGGHNITASVAAPSQGTLTSPGYYQYVYPAATAEPTATPAPTHQPTASPTSLPAAQPTAPAVVPPAPTSTNPSPSASGSLSSPAALSTAPDALSLQMQPQPAPLTGGHSRRDSPGLLDAARIPTFQPLGGLSVISFGGALNIWPVLLLIILGSCAALVVLRHRWRREDADEEAVDLLNEIALTAAPAF